MGKLTKGSMKYLHAACFQSICPTGYPVYSDNIDTYSIVNHLSVRLIPMQESRQNRQCC